MKYLYMIQIQKADGTMWSQNVLAMDTTAGSPPVTTEAALNAINYGLTTCGSGSSLVTCNRTGQVDHDTTV